MTDEALALLAEAFGQDVEPDASPVADGEPAEDGNSSVVTSTLPILMAAVRAVRSRERAAQAT